ncbi:MAG: UDP-glucose/GDP-mannose dehydrogenase [uncultured bacterium]|uniref:UDP-glucose/GDP-mannose dehydrogenase n=3 Tax=Candidatus Daviesiibacteriota TaxID=1752718 RepID=A0A0G0I2M9_9BACT|nr:MAG: UDP-glucose/GDP-mannose dehydrogenase [uncultured bacterium]KKQ10361.1 MAG: UDP-glucose/GDP-mannose dehydrogenase [Candidatus Daviesbacteria bacterium GW2011_GWB1_36_5]KKQ15520.1 MAG: UDP-glucose/GDP-mannose dehydrogenase [Candidatus Daviesbacteria bacterium GW2011_GWA1_36_8]OGE17810.1 MAG: hypothetical protein A2858_03640 [Candidatus Daviesbacteria bacterium RIFCSPHIGHO2_01_FULL_36_37]
MSTDNTAFVGLSHLGLVTSICWSYINKNVFAIDLDVNLINNLSQGNNSFTEPNLKKLFRKTKKFFRPTNDFSKIQICDLVFISIDTPTDKPTSLGKINLLIKKTIPYLKDDACLILLSQIPVGFTRTLETKIRKKNPSLRFNLYYFLNTLIIGESVTRFLNPERIVLGCSSPKTTIQPTLGKALSKFKCPVIKMSYESAEMTKTAVNLFLASSITAANTLSDFCEYVGADINEIIPALKLDKRIGNFAYLNPTLRISGGHLERELWKLNKLDKKYKLSPGLEKSILSLNEKRINWLILKIKKLKLKSICLWGLAYKKNTDSTENAASIKLIKALGKKIIIKAYDPKATIPKSIRNYERVSDKFEALENSDALVILTPWDEFKSINIDHLRIPIIIDCVGIFYPKKENLKKIRYISMGVGTSF